MQPLSDVHRFPTARDDECHRDPIEEGVEDQNGEELELHIQEEDLAGRCLTGNKDGHENEVDL